MLGAVLLAAGNSCSTPVLWRRRYRHHWLVPAPCSLHVSGCPPLNQTQPHRRSAARWKFHSLQRQSLSPNRIKWLPPHDALAQLLCGIGLSNIRMDPLSALGIAAAVVQFVDFGQRLFSETWSIYHSASGQSVALTSLSTVSQDLSQLSDAIKRSLGAVRQNGHNKTADQQLYRLCDECDAIAQEIQRLLSRMDNPFRKELESSRKVQETRPSTGRCFRVALRNAIKIVWQREAFEALEARLEHVRQNIVSTATISVWMSSRDTKNWENEFSAKLDSVISTLNQAVTTMGPNPKQDRDQDMHSIEARTAGSLQMNGVAKEVVDRIWSKDWQPEASLSFAFPQETTLSARQVSKVISESLRFSTIDSREDAITKTFKTTYKWIFDDKPPASDFGEPLWSSLPRWLKSNSNVPYWITGKPGSGKSTMMKHIATHQSLDPLLMEWAAGLPICKVKYYAWKPGLDLAKSEEGLLRTLLHQVLTPHPNLVPIVCPRRWALFHTTRAARPDSSPDWQAPELRESFAKLMEQVQSSIRLVVFIDGLDEFKIPPVQLCSMIREMAAHDSLKVCVASRPWPEFSDAFSHSPRMQMHLLNGEDIHSFVTGIFRGVPAFTELNDLYRDAGDQLLGDIVQRSDGVFLWTALVTTALLEAVSEGASLVQLQELLNEMPPEIENLYDAIYSAIPPKLLPDVSVMLLLFESACHPVLCRNIWLADELRCRPISIDVGQLSKDKLRTSLKRRLGARTRGMLELVSETDEIAYLHRTAAEWIRQPRVWSQLCAKSPAGFEPHMALLQAETAILGVYPPNGHYLLGDEDFWSGMTRALFYASLVDPETIPDTVLINAVHKLRQDTSRHFAGFPGVSEDLAIVWPSYQAMEMPSMRRNTNNFEGLAVQFAIMPYVKHRLQEEPGCFQIPNDGWQCMIAQAIYGFERYTALGVAVGVDPYKISHAKRTDLLRCLLLNGVLPLSMEELLYGVSSEREDVLRYSTEIKELLLTYRPSKKKKRHRISAKIKNFF